MFTTLLLILAFAYFTMMLVVSIAVKRSRPSFDHDFTPSVSVIIAARNEEHRIMACLESISRLAYPADKLEILVVNDESTDNTVALVERYASTNPRLRLLHSSKESGLRGKVNALNEGIKSSRGDILMFTDADCVVPSTWVKETVKYYADFSVGLVAGFTLLKSVNLFERVQALDWFAQFTMASGAVALGVPITAVGNNLSVRRTAYDRTGGYEQIPFSVTEDHALFKAIVESSGFSVRFPLERGTLVQSLPCQGLRDLLHQKLRWFSGGMHLDASAIIVFAAMYLLKLLLVFNLFVPSWEGTVAILLSITADALLVFPSLQIFRRMELLATSIPFSLYLIGYILVLPVVLVFRRKVVWKGREFAGDTTKKKAPRNPGGL